MTATSFRPSQRLRAAGTIVLVVGLAGAALYYWVETRSHPQSVDELLPGFSQARARQTAILMGGLVVTLSQWADALADPTNQAVIIAVASVLIALGCFRIATLLDRPVDDERRVV